MKLTKVEIDKLTDKFKKLSKEEIIKIAERYPSKKKLKNKLFAINKERSGAKLYKVAGFETKKEFYQKVEAEGFRTQLSKKLKPRK